MEAAFFKDVNNLNIHNGSFVMKSGPDNSRRTINHHYDTTINDRSQRTTNYGGYTNYGQHADGGGQINNYAPPPTNNRPGNGYRQYPPPNNPYYPPNDWTPSYTDEDNFDDYPQPPRGQYPPFRQRDRANPGDRDYFGHNPLNPASQSEPRLDKKRAKEPKFSRAKTEVPYPPTKGFDINSPQFRTEYESMSPQMKAYVRELGFDPQDSLSDRMAGVTLDDPGRRRSRSPGYGSPGYGNYTPNVPRKGKKIAPRPAIDDSDDSEDLDDSDSDSANGGQQYPTSYTHNDNRVITKHVNSNNVNTENVVDSYNDNSTRTDIKKNSAR